MNGQSMKAEQENIINAMRWAAEYITEYNRSGGGFDPFAALTETNKKQRHFINCVDLYEELARVTEAFREARARIDHD